MDFDPHEMQAEHVLEVVPGDAAHRVLGDQTGYDDA
jgi:hypothetical protein